MLFQEEIRSQYESVSLVGLTMFALRNCWNYDIRKLCIKNHNHNMFSISFLILPFRDARLQNNVWCIYMHPGLEVP